MLFKIIRDLNKEIENILKRKLEDFDLSIGQWEVLKSIYESESNKINANELEKILNIDKRLLSLTLKKLEELRYIERVELPQDKRKKYIILTIKSLEIAEDLLLIEDEINQMLLLNFDSFENVEDTFLSMVDSFKLCTEDEK